MLSYQCVWHKKNNVDEITVEINLAAVSTTGLMSLLKKGIGITFYSVTA